MYQTKSSILFIIFNRLDTTLKVLAQIKLAKPKKLYITADGPRPGRAEEAIKCANVITAVLDFIDWECEVFTLFRAENVGPKEAISSAIDWFFENEDEGIILEHDCLPAPTFFSYCDNLLERYRDDKRIWLISGFNFNTKKKWGDASYYFSNLTNGWGWATWKRSWASYDKNLNQFEAEEIQEPLMQIFGDKLIVDRWVEIFNDTKAGKIDTWDYQVTFAHLLGHSLTVVPNYNLVSNIGFGEFAENTLNANSPFANVPLEEIEELKHPNIIMPQDQADYNLLFEEFGLRDKIAEIKRNNTKKKRFKRWLKKMFSF